MKAFKLILPLIALCFSTSLVCAQEIVRTYPMNEIQTLGTTIALDKYQTSDGNGSIKISSIRPITICLGEVTKLEIEESEVVYKAVVKSEDLDGTAFLEMWCTINGKSFFSRGLTSTISGKSDWKEISTPFSVKKGEKIDKISFSIVLNGRGTIWIDGVKLLKSRLK